MFDNKTPASDSLSPATEILSDQVEIIGISFRTAGKVYYFDANGIKAREGDHAIVETARGQEYGTVTLSNRPMPKNQLVLPLRKVLRLANKEDRARYEANRQKEEEALHICQQKVAEHKLDMKLIDVEYTFDNSKLLFYFTSDDRVDFRELVKDLASVFRTRIELRQIGIRDEAKLLGGLGVCGREFCCHSFLGDFAQVTIKMAKEQNLSLNSSKISGACGKLMCCLRFEHEAYQEEIRLTPKNDAVVLTPDGVGTVVDSKPLQGLVRVRLDGDDSENTHVYHRDDLSPYVRGENEPKLPARRPDRAERTDARTGDRSADAASPRRGDRRPERTERTDRSERSSDKTANRSDRSNDRASARPNDRRDRRSDKPTEKSADRPNHDKQNPRDKRQSRPQEKHTERRQEKKPQKNIKKD